jgi:hypothetical protein
MMLLVWKNAELHHQSEHIDVRTGPFESGHHLFAPGNLLLVRSLSEREVREQRTARGRD